jgi:hypothetical protein
MTKPRSQKKKELYKLAVARSDITAALKTCNLLIQHVKEIGDNLYQPLFHAIVIAYARPFTRNKPLGPLPSEWSRFSNSALQQMHNNLVSARRQFIAHSDEKIRKVYIYPPGTLIGATGLRSAGVSIAISTHAYGISKFYLIRRLCYDLGSRLNDRTEALLAELYEGRVLPSEHFLLTFNDEL